MVELDNDLCGLGKNNNDGTGKRQLDMAENVCFWLSFTDRNNTLALMKIVYFFPFPHSLWPFSRCLQRFSHFIISISHFLIYSRRIVKVLMALCVWYSSTCSCLLLHFLLKRRLRSRCLVVNGRFKHVDASKADDQSAKCLSLSHWHPKICTRVAHWTDHQLTSSKRKGREKRCMLFVVSFIYFLSLAKHISFYFVQLFFSFVILEIDLNAACEKRRCHLPRPWHEGSNNYLSET